MDGAATQLLLCDVSHLAVGALLKTADIRNNFQLEYDPYFSGLGFGYMTKRGISPERALAAATDMWLKHQLAAGAVEFAIYATALRQEVVELQKHLPAWDRKLTLLSVNHRLGPVSYGNCSSSHAHGFASNAATRATQWFDGFCLPFVIAPLYGEDDVGETEWLRSEETSGILVAQVNDFCPGFQLLAGGRSHQAGTLSPLGRNAYR